jgi:Na+/proline symporter
VQILLGIIVAVVVGVAVHFVLPGRDTRGVVLAPAVAAAFGAAAWTILTWAGLALDNPLLWLAALVVPLVLTVPIVLGLTAARTRADAAERERLKLV